MGIIKATKVLIEMTPGLISSFSEASLSSMKDTKIYEIHLSSFMIL